MWRKKDEFRKSFYESNFSNRDSLKLLSLSDPKYMKSISTTFEGMSKIKRPVDFIVRSEVYMPESSLPTQI